MINFFIASQQFRMDIFFSAFTSDYLLPVEKKGDAQTAGGCNVGGQKIAPFPPKHSPPQCLQQQIYHGAWNLEQQFLEFSTPITMNVLRPSTERQTQTLPPPYPKQARWQRVSV